MNILCFIVGAIRTDFKDIRTNIMTIKEQIHANDKCTFIFLTWAPIVKSYKFYTINYYYDYDKSALENELHDIVNDFIFIENPDLNTMVKCMNKCPPIATFYQTYMHEYINTKNNNNIQYDYVIKTRNDLTIRMNNIYDYFNDATYVPPCFWSPTRDNHGGILRLFNDHFYITTYTKFINFDFSINNINLLASASWDNEELNRRLINPEKLIDVTEYIIQKPGDTIVHVARLTKAI